MDETPEGLTGVSRLVDDISVTVKSREEYDTRRQAMLEEANTKRLKFVEDKLTVGARNVQYFEQTHPLC